MNTEKLTALLSQELNLNTMIIKSALSDFEYYHGPAMVQLQISKFEFSDEFAFELLCDGCRDVSCYDILRAVDKFVN